MGIRSAIQEEVSQGTPPDYTCDMCKDPVSFMYGSSLVSGRRIAELNAMFLLQIKNEE